MDHSERPSKRQKVLRHANPELVLVEVGKEKEKFMLPKSLLCHKSSFLAAALKPDSPFVEAKHNVVKMPEEDASLFDDFVSWVYNEYQTLRFDPNKQSTVEDAMQELTEDAMQELIEDAMKELIDLFDLGDRLGALELQREMIREFFILLAGIEILKEMAIDHFVWGERTHWAHDDFQLLISDQPEFGRACMKKLGTIALEKEESGKRVKNPFHGTADHYLTKFDARSATT